MNGKIFYFFGLVVSAQICLFQRCSSEGSSEKKLTFNEWKGQGCELVSEADLVRIMGVRPYEDVLNSRSLPDDVFCLRTWKKPDWMQRESNNEKSGAAYLSPHNRLVVNVVNYRSLDEASHRFEVLLKERRSDFEEEVEGLGYPAVWSTSTTTLVAKKDSFFLQVALEHMDTPHDNLAKAKGLAAIALKRI
jgi:hypothetical protein